MVQHVFHHDAVAATLSEELTELLDGDVLLHTGQ